MNLAGLRRVIGLCLLAAAAVTAVLAWRQCREYRVALPADYQRIPRKARSVLLITMDTTRADHLQPYGAANVATPALQRLAEQGTLFERACSVAPITLVAHTTMHTGLTPLRHGVRNNGLHYVPGQVTTLAERLRQHGFRTAAFVSAAVLERRYGLDQGFELYDDDLSSGRERHPRAVPDRPAEATVKAARSWLDGLDQRDRFFLWVHFYDPHAAYSPPPPYRDRYRERLYDGEIAYMDAQIGQLLEHPLLRPDATVVMALGDHGESLGEHGEQTHALLAYDSTLHVPWIARVPGGPAGRRVSGSVGQVDVTPTLLDLLGLEGADGADGRSLVPLMEGLPGPEDRALYAETYLPHYTYGWAKLRSLRRGLWKYVEAPTPELYDLRRDPRELSNVVKQQPGLAHDLGRDLEAYLASSGGADREETLALDSESSEALRALGYLAVGSGAPRRGERPDPKDVIDLHVGLEVAHQLMRDRLFSEAERRLRAVLERDPENLAALLDLAEALQGQQRFDEAAKIAEKALSLDPKYPRSHLQLAQCEAQRGRNEQALKLVDVALGIDPRLPEAHIQKTLLLARLQRVEEARAVIRAAVASQHEHARLGAVHVQVVELPQGQLAEAQARLERSLARDPFLVLGWRLLGEVHERRSQPADAIRAYEEGLRREPDDADLHGRLGLLLARQGTDPKAEVHLREAIRLSEREQPHLRVALGAHLAERGRLKEALEEYERVLATEPRNPGARNNRAVALYRLGRRKEATAEWKRLAAEFPRQADVHNNLAVLALEDRRWAEAEAYARRALALDARVAEAWSNLGIAQDEQARYREAEDSFAKALAADPAYWQARNNLATTLRKEKRFKEAAAAFEEVLQQVPAEPGVHLELGDLYAGPLADPQRARQHYNAFLRGAPRHERAEDVRRRLASLR